MLPLAILVPANVQHRSGGTVYNEAIARQARRAGCRVTLVPVPGAWPSRDPGAVARVLAAAGRHRRVLVDGLIGSLCPEALTALRSRGARTGLLVHLPERFGGRAQARALEAADVVVVTSAWTGRWLLAHAWPLTGRPAIHLTRRLTVAVPGTGDRPSTSVPTSAPMAPDEPACGPVIACIAALTPNKNQVTLLGALSRLTDLGWTAWMIGSARADPRWAARVAEAAAPLGDRVAVTGELTAGALAARWPAIDLLVLPSTWESWGMVVTEALSRGIPAVVGRDTGAAEALAGPRRSGPWHSLPRGTGRGTGRGTAGGAGREPAHPATSRETTADAGEAPGGQLPGAVVPGQDAGAIAAVLRTWLTDAARRDQWATAAREVHPPGWGPPTAAILSVMRMTGPTAGTESGRRDHDGARRGQGGPGQTRRGQGGRERAGEDWVRQDRAGQHRAGHEAGEDSVGENSVRQDGVRQDGVGSA